MPYMAKGTVEKRPLTEDEIADAKRLKSIWETAKSTNKHMTQTWLASETGLGKQSNINQYLNAHIQLNPAAVLAFARVLRVHPNDISPRMYFPTGMDLPKAELDLLSAYRQTHQDFRGEIVNYAKFMAQSHPASLLTASNDQT